MGRLGEERQSDTLIFDHSSTPTAGLYSVLTIGLASPLATPLFMSLVLRYREAQRILPPDRLRVGLHLQILSGVLSGSVQPSFGVGFAPQKLLNR
jgi:hypothetical protein